MNIIILTEGSIQMGYGHLGRCIALNNLFSQSGAHVNIILRGDKSGSEWLKNTPHYFFDWIVDADRLSPLLSCADIVIIDSYHAPQTLYDNIVTKVSLLVCVDDFQRITYPRDSIVINSCPGSENWDYTPIPKENLLLGSRYISLRDAFRSCPTKTIKKEITQFFIMLGGSDIRNITPKILKIINNHYPHITKKVVVSLSNKDNKELLEVCDYTTEILYNLSDIEIRDLIDHSDIAITAGGQTVYELVCCGLQPIIFKVIENQENIINWLLNQKLIESYLDWHNFTEDKLVHAINTISSFDARTTFASKAQLFIDGKGSDRIVQTIRRKYYQKILTINVASSDDLIDLWELANEKEVRAQSFNTNYIEKEEHERWFSLTLENPNRELYVFRAEKELVGQLRFDFAANKAIISISVSPKFRGMGMGIQMIHTALKQPILAEKQTTCITAEIKKQNSTSIQMFTRAGFIQQNGNADSDNITMIYKTGITHGE